ncbi:alpha/beta fold hydrolase [Spirosoma sp.]|uniref:esterase/lipase family protein n=1 Tax=Spirosoma sp. TaxID=1899569 RepID=UPI002604FC3F|nr:alpha/beta fold hydrolase [Spirosoma sp.]MCX6214109.1 alpha/beta fold hydrolase [Spirosoma sp.]
METLDDSILMADVQTVITLVHGTFATHAPWIQADSLMCRALHKHFGDTTQVIPFTWSGGNTHSARQKASKRLRDHLTDQVETYKDAHHYLVCHSHGGNVALHAISGTPLEDQISGVVCLATPFLVARKRNLGGDLGKHFTGAAGLVVAIVTGVMFGILPSWISPFRVRATVGVGLATLLVGLPMYFIAQRWLKFADGLLKDLTSPAIDPEKVIIMRSPADEASGALSLFQFVSHLSVRLYTTLFDLYEWTERVAVKLVKQKRRLVTTLIISIIVFSGLLYVILNGEYGSQSDWFSTGIYLLVVLVFFIGASAYCLLTGREESVTFFFQLPGAVVAWPVSLLLIILLLPFGWEIALANILLDVTAESTPIGSWRVQLWEPPTSDSLVARPLMHSVLYEDSRVLESICQWIESRNSRIAT